MAKLESPPKPNRSPEGLSVRAGYYGRRISVLDAAGLCRICGIAQRMNGETRCFRCIEKIRLKNVTARKKRFESGKCASCAQPRVDGKVHCARCAELTRVRHLARTSSPEGRVHGLVRRAKQRAKAQGLPFDLDLGALLPLPIVCPVLGIRLAFNGGRRKQNSPSLDRLRPALGYVRGNVRVISYRANELRRDATADELEAVARYARSIEGG